MAPKAKAVAKGAAAQETATAVPNQIFDFKQGAMTKRTSMLAPTKVSELIAHLQDEGLKPLKANDPSKIVLSDRSTGEVFDADYIFEQTGTILLNFKCAVDVKDAKSKGSTANRTIDFQVSNPKAKVDQPTRILRMGTRVILCYKTVPEAERVIDATLETFGIEVDPELLEIEKELAKLQKKKKELAKKATSTAASSTTASVAEELEEDDADLLAEDDEESEFEQKTDDDTATPLKTKGKR